MSLSGGGRRQKGVRGEHEVLELFEEHGFKVRGLESKGDHLAFKLLQDGEPLTVHIEVKRQETLRPDTWSRQAESEAPEHTVPLVVYRRSREPWRVLLTLDNFFERVK